MPSASEILYRNSCWGCGRKFKPGQEVYNEQPYEGQVFVYCEDCFTKALMLRLDEISGDAWTQPFLEIYKLLFPGEKTSKYAKPLIRAMQIFYIKNWEGMI